MTASMQQTSALLDRAARIALRGHGNVEPNPMVGCVVTDRSGRVIAEGHHRTCGGPHAEAIAKAVVDDEGNHHGLRSASKATKAAIVKRARRS